MRKITNQKCKISRSPYSIREFISGNGERMAVLVDTANGMPLFLPTIYATSMLRGGCKQLNTIKANLAALKVLYTWAWKSAINLEERLRNGEFLNLVEIDSIARMVRLAANELYAEADPYSAFAVPPNRRRPEKVRAISTGSAPRLVSGYTAAIRISYISAYLEWLAIYCTPNSRDRVAHAAERELMKTQLLARKSSPRYQSVNKNGDAFGREGLELQTQDRLVACINANSSENPWHDKELRKRNELLIVLLLETGIRRGELLGLTIDRINLQKDEISIARNPDDAEDPRTYEPNTKTRARVLPISPRLSDLIHEYVTRVRSKIPGARRHKFLFVEHRRGQPLSLPAFTKVFSTLRERVPDLPNNLSGHLLRHTWNERFSEKCDEQCVAESHEMKSRSYAMGWSETSGTAATYTKRSIRRGANKLMMKMQQDIVNKREDRNANASKNKD